MRYVWMFFLLIPIGKILSQEISVELIKTQALEADAFVGGDKFFNIYYINNQTLYKSGPGQIIEYAALNLGEITSVDIVNPLKISVFYRQSNTVVLLDNTLNEITRVDFSNLEDFRNSALATTANDRRLWIFNTDLQQLELFDYRLNKVVVQFPPMPALPISYTSNFNFCWIQNESTLTTFNIYGTIVDEQTTSTHFEKLEQSQNMLIGLKEDCFYIKRSNRNSFERIDDLENTGQEFSLIGEILYIYNGQNLMTYTIKSSK